MSDTITACTKLFESIINKYGPLNTVLIGIGIIVVLFLFRLYTDYRKDKERDKIIEEKERTVQRLAQEAREWRIVILKEKYKWTDEQVERFIHKGDFKDGAEARQKLEGTK